MSVHYLAAVWRAFIAPPGAKLVAATLADRADDSGAGIRFAVATIAKRCSMSERQVQRHRGELVRGGILRIERQAAQHAPTVYRMSLPRLEELARGDISVTPEGEPGETSASPLDEPRGDMEGAQGCHPRSPGVTPVSPKTSLRRPKDVSGEGSASAPSARCAPGAGAPPLWIDRVEWAKLFAARPELDPGEVAEAVEFHRLAGCPLEELNREVVRLRLTRGHRSFTPNYRRARPAGKPKPPAKDDQPQAKAAAPKLATIGGQVIPLYEAAHPLKRLLWRFGGPNVLKAERERMEARLHAAFPGLAPALLAPGRTVDFTEPQCERIGGLLSEEWKIVAARMKARRDERKAAG